MKRHISILLRLLLLSLVINLAVAWSFAWWAFAALPTYAEWRPGAIDVCKEVQIFTKPGWEMRLTLREHPFEHRAVESTGWPALSMHRKLDDAEFSARLFQIPGKIFTPLDLRRVSNLPMLPAWPGFALNTFFYAAALWVSLFLPRSLRRTLRRRRGQCAACGYPVGSSPVCTECGENL